MPPIPRRTWSAEDERRRRLEEDPDAYDVGPHSVTCAGCHRPIRLNATGRYYAANWNKHKMGCKNTNAASGAGAISVVCDDVGDICSEGLTVMFVTGVEVYWKSSGIPCLKAYRERRPTAGSIGTSCF